MYCVLCTKSGNKKYLLRFFDCINAIIQWGGGGGGDYCITVPANFTVNLSFHMSKL